MEITEYKIEDDPVTQRMHQHRSDEKIKDEEIVLPEEFFQIEQLLIHFMELYQNQEQNEELELSIMAFSDFINYFKDYTIQIVDFIQSFEKTEIFKGESLLWYLNDLFYIRESPTLMRNLLALFNTIIINLPFDYCFSFFKYNINFLISMIIIPDTGLKIDHGIDGSEFNIITFGEDKDLVRNYVVSILQNFIKGIYAKYQENQNAKLLDYCYSCSFDCLFPCSTAIDNMIKNTNRDIEQLLFYVDFLYDLLTNVTLYLQNNNSRKLDDDEECTLWGMIDFLTKYVTQPELPKISIAFSNLSHLIQLVKMLNFLDETFFSKVFYCFINIEKYRIENQKSLVDLLCSVASSYNDKVIRIMIDTFQKFQINSKEEEGSGEPLMNLLAKNENMEERQKFCCLCSTLVESCFEDFKIRKLNIIFPQLQTILLNQQVLLQSHKISFEFQQDGSMGQPNFFVILENGLVVQQNLLTIQKNGFLFINNGFREIQIFEDQPKKFDEQQQKLFILRNSLNAIGSYWIDFMYNNNILFFLCDKALNEDIYSNRTNAAQALSAISLFLPGSILADLIMNHDFIEIFHQLVGGEKDVYRCVIQALTSILNFISSLPTDSNSADLYFKLASTDLLNEIEDCGKSHEDQELMKLVDRVLDKAVIERDRFTSFLLHEDG